MNLGCSFPQYSMRFKFRIVFLLHRAGFLFFFRRKIGVDLNKAYIISVGPWNNDDLTQFFFFHFSLQFIYSARIISNKPDDCSQI